VNGITVDGWSGEVVSLIAVTFTLAAMRLHNLNVYHGCTKGVALVILTILALESVRLGTEDV
jgi:hypothetical protein